MFTDFNINFFDILIVGSISRISETDPFKIMIYSR